MAESANRRVERRSQKNPVGNPTVFIGKEAICDICISFPFLVLLELPGKNREMEIICTFPFLVARLPKWR